MKESGKSNLTKTTTTTSTVTGSYVYTIGGEVEGVPHEPGDDVPGSVPQSKVKEWLRAGAVQKKPKPAKKRKED